VVPLVARKKQAWAQQEVQLLAAPVVRVMHRPRPPTTNAHATRITVSLL